MIKITKGRPSLKAVLKNPPTKIMLYKPKITHAIPNAKKLAFIRALLRYTAFHLCLSYSRVFS